MPHPTTPPARTAPPADMTPGGPVRRPASGSLRRLLAASVALAVVFGAFVGTAAPASADSGTGSYPVAFTGGEGVYLRSAPNDDPATRLYAVPDGTMIPVECETTGTPRTNDAGQTSDVYVRAAGGVYVPSIYIKNGVLGRSAAPDCADLDAARAAELQPKTVADYLREGKNVVYTTDGPDRLRGYYSHSYTDKAANAIGAGADRAAVANNLACTAVGVLAAFASKGESFSTSTTVGAGSGFVCGFADNQLAPIAATARAASSTGKCFEMRLHRDGSGWTPDDNGWTMTDNADYCA